MNQNPKKGGGKQKATIAKGLVLNKKLFGQYGPLT
jgi:hypothetical protein